MQVSSFLASIKDRRPGVLTLLRGLATVDRCEYTVQIHDLCDAASVEGFLQDPCVLSP